MHAHSDLSQKSLLAVLVILALVPVATSEGNDTTTTWYVEKGTWPETYLASMNRICELERQQGIAAPVPKSDGTLPMIVCPAAFDSSQSATFEIDVTGVDTLYLGSSYNMCLERAKLVDRSGGTHGSLTKRRLSIGP